MDDEYDGSGKSASYFLHRETPLLKIRCDATDILKIKEGLAYLSLDLIYHLKG
jgi:hypothetical protein